MVKKMYYFLFLLITTVILFNNGIALAYDFDNNIAKNAINETSIKLQHLSSIKEITDVKFTPLNWSDIKWGCYDFSSNEYKKQIRNTKSILVYLIFNNNISCGLKIANFKNEKDSKIGFFDQFRFYPKLIDTFFSKNSINKKNVFGDKYLVGNKYAHIKLLCGSCVGILQFIKDNGTFTEKDFEFTDKVTLLIIELMEKSSIINQ